MNAKILKKISDKIGEIYDLDLAEEFTDIFVELVCRTKETSKRYWSLAKALATIEKERDDLGKELDMERKKVGILEEIHWEHVKELYELRGAPGQE